ncbi:DinB family protein [Roseisolibacter sp. H3M3-2]|uniref:DinB family protein n=1 Tax=Roseisolibacter sp. H3M3-2 TaxID=3031323 RepID=UPI0023DCD50E|nr:DinB family protein [Roseisolibacter sp. H3M3-2]MDF1503109.1 DinB family protein [Roseisolibacter sp. H3M3-2]
MSALSPAALAVRPAAGEFAPYYARYIDQVPDGDVLELLERQLEETVAVADGFGEAGAAHRYAPGKWSVKQVLGHLTDAERIFTYRAVAAARGETGALPAFDENAYVERADFDARTLNSLLGELTAVRRATLAFFRGLPPETFDRTVVANNVPVSVRALAWIVAGHERHHVKVLRERYG